MGNLVQTVTLEFEPYLVSPAVTRNRHTDSRVSVRMQIVIQKKAQQLILIPSFDYSHTKWKYFVDILIPTRAPSCVPLANVASILNSQLYGRNFSLRSPLRV